MRGLYYLLTGLLLLSLTGWSQEMRKPVKFGYFNRTEAGVGFGLGSFKTDIYDGVQKSIKNNEIVISAQTINGITYQGRVGLGFGAGIERWQHGLFFPLFGQLYYDLKPAGNTFFGSVNIGTSLGTRDSTTY